MFALPSFALGNFVGPSLGGYLVEVIGFRQTTVAFQLIGCFFLVVDTFSLACSRFRSTNQADLKRRTRMDLYERII